MIFSFENTTYIFQHLIPYDRVFSSPTQGHQNKKIIRLQTDDTKINNWVFVFTSIIIGPRRLGG